MGEWYAAMISSSDLIAPRDLFSDIARTGGNSAQGPYGRGYTRFGSAVGHPRCLIRSKWRHRPGPTADIEVRSVR